MLLDLDDLMVRSGSSAKLYLLLDFWPARTMQSFKQAPGAVRTTKVFWSARSRGTPQRYLGFRPESLQAATCLPSCYYALLSKQQHHCNQRAWGLARYHALSLFTQRVHRGLHEVLRGPHLKYR